MKYWWEDMKTKLECSNVAASLDSPSKCKKNNKTSLIPNPFTDQIRIDYFSESQSIVTLTIMDQSGNVVRTETLNASEGLNKFQFNNLDDLKPGLYFAIIGREDEKEIIKLIKL